MTNSRFETDKAPAPAAAGTEEKLTWDAFSALYFPERRRHDLEAVAAYAAYRRGRDWQSGSSQTPSPPRLTLVPNGPTPSAVEAESGDAAAERLLVAVAAEQVW